MQVTKSNYDSCYNNLNVYEEIETEICKFHEIEKFQISKLMRDFTEAGHNEEYSKATTIYKKMKSFKANPFLTYIESTIDNTVVSCGVWDFKTILHYFVNANMWWFYSCSNEQIPRKVYIVPTQYYDKFHGNDNYYIQLDADKHNDESFIFIIRLIAGNIYNPVVLRELRTLVFAKYAVESVDFILSNEIKYRQWITRQCINRDIAERENNLNIMIEAVKNDTATKDDEEFENIFQEVFKTIPMSEKD